MISLEKLKILTPLQKLPKNEGDLGKLIVAKGFEKLPKVELIAQSGHTGRYVKDTWHQWPILQTLDNNKSRFGVAMSRKMPTIRVKSYEH